LLLTFELSSTRPGIATKLARSRKALAGRSVDLLAVDGTPILARTT
jgi:hypothetical protein